MRTWVIRVLAVLLVCLGLGLYPEATDADHHGSGRGWGRKAGDHDGRRHARQSFGPVENPAYREQCGGCHMAYQPGLLPAASWQRILAGLGQHFGTDVTLDQEDRAAIAGYLEANAAERSRSNRAAKISRSLAGQTPARITEIPYIRRKHAEVPAQVFQRTAVGSPSNCRACHLTAEQGVYEDDLVRIPD